MLPGCAGRGALPLTLTATGIGARTVSRGRAVREITSRLVPAARRKGTSVPSDGDLAGGVL
jgi:hypothetical protein